MYRYPILFVAFLGLIFATACDTVKKVGGLLAAVSVNTVTVMSFNIMHDKDSPEHNLGGWDQRKPLVLGTINTAKADVVGLQEAKMYQVEYFVSQMPRYGFVGRGREALGGGESVSILYLKDKFELVDSGHFWFSNAPDTPGTKGGEKWGNQSHPRMVTWVRLKVKKTGKSFYAYNTHLDSSHDSDGELARARSVELLAQRIAARSNPSEHFIVTGDFNATEDSWPIKYLLRTMLCYTGVPCANAPIDVKMIDVWRKVNTGPGGTKCGNDNSGRKTTSDGNRIDYIFAWDPTGNAMCATNPSSCAVPEVNSAQAFVWGPSCASDHRATIAELVLPLGGEAFIQ